MRICFIAPGKFTHIGPYLDYFKEAGHDVHFLALAPGPERDVPTHNVGLDERFHKLLGKWSYLPAMLRARKVVRSLAPDVVHAHYATSSGLAACVCGVHPYMVTAHGTDVTQGAKSILWRPILRRIFRNADCVNPVSDGLQEMVLDLGIPLQKVEMLTLGIDTQLFKFSERPFSYPAAPLRLICTRRLESVYDHTTLIKSLAILKTRNIDFGLTIVGDGIMREDLEMLASELGISDRVTFAGAVPNTRLPAFLAQHDIYLSASTRDGTSLCLLEAMASGLYPIVSNIKANAEWIRHGHNGLMHKVSDPQNLAECILACLETAGQPKAALRLNRGLVMMKGDRATNMKRLEQIYFRLRAKGDSTRPSGARPDAVRRASSPCWQSS